MIKRQLTPKIIAISTSLFVAVLSTAAIVLVNWSLQIEVPFYFYIILCMIIFIVSLGSFSFSLMRFIQDKLKIIYKTIGKPLKFEKEISNNFSSNIMRSVERDVGEWALTKNKQIRELRKLEVYRKEFVGNVSHELRTPIFNAQG